MLLFEAGPSQNKGGALGHKEQQRYPPGKQGERRCYCGYSRAHCYQLLRAEREAKWKVAGFRSSKVLAGVPMQVRYFFALASSPMKVRVQCFKWARRKLSCIISVYT